MLGSPAGPSGYATLTVCWMHCIYAYSLILVLMNRRSFALVPVGGRAPRMGRHVQSVMNRWHGIFNGAVRSARCLRSVMICAERNPNYDAFGAPLPPVEISINATRVEVAANVEDGHSEAWSVVQQLRGSAPYVELHRDSTMVVHICSQVLDDDAMFYAVGLATRVPCKSESLHRSMQKVDPL